MFESTKPHCRVVWLVLVSLFPVLHAADSRSFSTPPREAFPETWFHLIGGNVAKPGLTADLEAVAAAGLQGIQLFHGRGQAWPGVEPQIQTLSPPWDDMISHVATESDRLGLQLTLQNCPGWAMSGGPWITPDKAMRHLIWSRLDVEGGQDLAVTIEQPDPSGEPWRDYREVAVLAFPTPQDDHPASLQPVTVRSNRPEFPWAQALAGSKEAELKIPVAGGDPTWVDFVFAEPVTLRTMELPGLERLSLRFMFDPAAEFRLLARDGPGDAWREVAAREIPRGNWQDRLPHEWPLVLAWPDHPAREFRLVFHNRRPLSLPFLRLSAAARVHNWPAQAGYVLRSLDRTPPPVQAPAAFIAADSIVDLTERLEADGRLRWTAPPGRWTILRFGHVNTGVTNKPAPPEATGWECDKLATAGADQHFAGYIGRLTEPGAPLADGRLQGMLIDSWECYTQTWTPAMEPEFSARRGYGLRPWLPALAGWVVRDHATSERFLRDWRATISDLLVHNYFGRLAELARARGLRLSFEAATGDVTPGDLLEYYKGADVPMCEFWRPNDPHWGGLETKPFALAVSAAHLYGKPLVAAEAFTNASVNYAEHPFQFKAAADRAFAAGVNHIVLHTYTHNPRLDLAPGTSFGSRIGSPFIRGQTWWQHMPDFTAYLARCSWLLRQGRPVADVLWYLGDDLDHKPRSDAPFPAGYKFDYLNNDGLLHRLETLHDGRLATPEGVTWAVLWLDPARNQRLTVPTLRKLRELVQAGAVVIGHAPQSLATLTGGPAAEQEFAALRRELWGNDPMATGDRRVGRGRLRWGGELGAHLAEMGVGPDVAGLSATQWTHRRLDDEECYFLAADRVTPLRANVRFRATGVPEFWDPLTGNMHALPVYAEADGFTTVALDLPAAGSGFVRFRPGRERAAVERVTLDGQVVYDVRDGSRIEQGAPFPVQGLAEGVEEQPWQAYAPPAVTFAADGKSLLFWQSGEVEVIQTDGIAHRFGARLRPTLALNGPWLLDFPLGEVAPATLMLSAVQPWSELADPVARDFAGTATYATELRLDATAPDESAWLDLGRVGVIAEVRVNGATMPLQWAAPHRVDITPALRAGNNRIEVRVTNTWFNRLARDAGLPPAERRTWSINGPKADAPRQLAGLAGPVTIRFARRVALP